MSLQTFTSSLLADLKRLGSPLRGTLNDLQAAQSDSVWEKDVLGQSKDSLSCLWWRVEEITAEGRLWSGYRVIKLSELTFLPQEARNDANLVKKQATLLRGLYAANVELITLSFGVFDPPLGIVQCYGAGARHEEKEPAIALAESGHAAVIASLAAQYPQIRLRPLDSRKVVYLAEALHRMPHATALIGQPDPREAPRGGAQKQASGGQGGAGDFSEQQNELLFRALSRAREEFVFMNVATPVARSAISLMLESLSNMTSPFASRQQGVTSIGFGVSLPVILNAGSGQSAGQGYGENIGQATSESIGQAHGTAHTDGVTDASSWSHSIGKAHTEGTAVSDSITHTTGITRSHAVSNGTSENWGTAHTDSQSHTVGVAVTNSSSDSVGSSSGFSFGGSIGGSHSDSSGISSGTNVSAGSSTSLGVSTGANLSAGIGIKGGVTAGLNASGSHSVSTGVSDGTSSGTSDGNSWGSSWGQSFGSSVGHTEGSAVTHSESFTVGQADTSSHGVGVSASTTDATGSFESTSIGHAVTKSQADSLSEGWSEGGSHAVSSSDSISDSTSVSRGATNSYGVSQSRGLSASESHGLGAGVAPSFSLSKSFAWKDEAAVTLTMLLEQQMNILKEAHEEGGFYSDAYILTRTANGQNVAEAAAVQAFGGSQGVVTHLQPRRPSSPEERDHLRRHAQCFTPSTLTETLGVINGYAYSTLLTPTQQAAYSTPGLFEEGTALTIQERTPPFAFNPDMRGDVVLGFQFSTERGEMTESRLMLSEDKHFHSLFAADTGYGKTVAAERYAFEACKYWRHRVVVLDFGAGWRRMINAPLDRDRVDLYQLAPGSLRPFRWNFLQIGRRITPDQQWLATSELIANAGRMGPRQLGYIRRALRQLYVEHGVMPSKANEEVDLQSAQKWRELQPGEIEVIRADRARRGVSGLVDPMIGEALIGLRPEDRQAIAVHRSRGVTVSLLYERLNKFLAEAGRDQTAKTSLEGVMLRLEPFTQGELARMYSSSERNVAVENLGLLGIGEDAERYGMCILEGGAQMDDYAKALILSLVAWHLYHDAFKRREQSIGTTANRPLDIYFEEASKILSGVGGGATSDSVSDKPTSTERWQEMWRDGRKYKVFLHPIVQTLHDLPPGIQSSCNNAFFSQIKDLKDRDLAMGHIGKSEKGFTDEEYKRFISRVPIALAVVKLGYSTDVADIEPMLMKPLLVPGVEPTNEEIARRFGI